MPKPMNRKKRDQAGFSFEYLQPMSHLCRYSPERVVPLQVASKASGLTGCVRAKSSCLEVKRIRISRDYSLAYIVFDIRASYVSLIRVKRDHNSLWAH